MSRAPTDIFCAADSINNWRDDWRSSRRLPVIAETGAVNGRRTSQIGSLVVRRVARAHHYGDTARCRRTHRGRLRTHARSVSWPYGQCSRCSLVRYPHRGQWLVRKDLLPEEARADRLSIYPHHADWSREARCPLVWHVAGYTSEVVVQRAPCEYFLYVRLSPDVCVGDPAIQIS